MAVIAARVAAADEAGTVPPFQGRIPRELSLSIVDDVAAALNGANVLVAVATHRNRRTGALQDIWRTISLAADKAVAAQLFGATGRKRHRRLTNVFSLLVLLSGERINARQHQQKQDDPQEFSRRRRHELVLAP